MEFRPMAAGAMDLVAFVDGQVGGFARELDDGIPFFRAEFAASRAEGLDARDGVPLPEDIYFHLDIVFDILFGGAPRYLGGEVGRKGVGTFAVGEEVLGVLDMLLDSLLNTLLGVANVTFARVETGGLIHDDGGPAFAHVGTKFLIAAVAWKVDEILGDEAVVDLGVEVAL